MADKSDRSKAGRRKAAKSVGRERRRREAPDTFGTERESRIVQSGVRYTFTPHEPVRDLPLLYGRNTEVRKLIESLNTPGQHVLLYGDRGVGKSSLANVVANVIETSAEAKKFVKRCDQSDRFETILRGPLEEVGKGLELTEVTTSSGRARKATVGYGSTAVGSDKQSGGAETFKAHRAITPSTAAEDLARLPGLLLIDEFDAIKSDDEKREIAELIKQLSDAGSSLKLMVVGIAETATELTAAHPSVQRCLRETKLGRMTYQELEEIVVAGVGALGLDFDDSVIDRIVRLSAGYPYFTHLLALKCAEGAIGDQYTHVGDAELEAAMAIAVDDAESTLKRQYDDSVRSTSDMYREILAAAASLDVEEFTAVSLRSAIYSRTGQVINQGSLNNYFSRLVSTGGERVLLRVGKGVYRFSDPRMQSFVRIANRMA